MALRRSSRGAALLGFLFVLSSNLYALDRQYCIDVDHRGVAHQVNSLDQVPQSSRDAANCFSLSDRPNAETPADNSLPTNGGSSARDQGSARTSAGMVAPNEIELSGNLRRESMPSSIGRIQLRWPRSVEKIFGRTPVRAMQDAAKAVSRALKKNAFPLELQRFDLDWDVVFMDADVPVKQIPTWLVSGCHPAWMVPPANIYVVAQRVAAGCGPSRKVSSSVADGELAEVLIHEIGHAVEHVLLPTQFGRERWRAEGFATWFTTYAADFSSIISGPSVERERRLLAASSLERTPQQFVFQGTAADYARASFYFHAVVDRRRLSGLMKIYSAMEEKGLPFKVAVDEKIGWREAQFEKEVAELISGG